jgi:hypothetical protein
MQTPNMINVHELERGIQATLGALAEIDCWYNNQRNLLWSYPEPALSQPCR